MMYQCDYSTLRKERMMTYSPKATPSDTRIPLRYVRCQCGVSIGYRWPCWCARCRSPHPAAIRAKAREGSE